MQDQTFFMLQSFLSDHLNVSKEKIHKKTRIGEDLGVDGEDAYELLVEYSKIFNVDISKFKYHDYFGPEGCNPFLLPIYWIGYFLGVYRLKTLTVDDLMRGIEEGNLKM